MSSGAAGDSRLRGLLGQNGLDLASALVASARDAIVAKTVAGTIVLWNAGAERLFGYSAAEALGQPIGMIVPAGLQAEHEEIMRRVAAGEGVEPFETIRQHRSGALIAVSIAVSPIRDAGGRLVGASKIARDISEQKLAEQRVAHQVAAEQSARALAEAANRGKDEFLAMLGHELRNPLAAIASAARVLELIGSVDPSFVQAQQIIERQVQHAARVVADVLDVTRVTAGKVLLTPRPVQLGESVAQCIDMLASAGRIRNHRFSFAADAEVWTNADPVRLQQILTNLLDNAVKYTPAGGAIDVRVWAEDAEVVVRVEDSGIGIPGDLLPRVFDLFVQGERPAGMSGDGLGVGLPLVRSLAELHGGSVEVASPGSGRGSVFTVRLPRCSPPSLAVV
jgi:PAS domain S-box-containing protein